MYERAVVFLQEVRSELTKVNWPTRSELTGATIVVIALSVIVAFYVGVIDVIASYALSFLLRA
ncbi:MAG: preprotein translocase subunit SecE [candidate division Zixibacteria bacterium]|nr:preprotein translocase subunit SecE [candidate division Zixibacteria bacterium]